MSNFKPIDSNIEDVKHADSIHNAQDNTIKMTKSAIAKQCPNCVTTIHSIRELYNCQRALGHGVSGSVFLAQSRRTYKQYALKQMLRSDKHNYDSFIREIKALNALHHPNLIQMNDAYVSDHHYYIATEYCSGGTLHERLKKVKRLSERQSVSILRSILEVIGYIHSNCIAHRDIKLSNIAFDNGDVLKLIDFGQSERICDLDQKDRNIFGSLNFLPPETSRSRKKRDLFAGDMWAVGVIAYRLTQGVFPFHAKDLKSMMRCVRKSPLKWNANVEISDRCKQFIQSLLNKDKNLRLTAKEALQHPWIVSHDTRLDEAISTSSAEISTKRPSMELELSDTVLNDISNDIDTILAEIDEETTNSVKRSDTNGKLPWKHTSEVSLDTIDVTSILEIIDSEIRRSSGGVK